jgi:hypothetical protein
MRITVKSKEPIRSAEKVIPHGNDGIKQQGYHPGEHTGHLIICPYGLMVHPSNCFLNHGVERESIRLCLYVVVLSDLALITPFYKVSPGWLLKMLNAGEGISMLDTLRLIFVIICCSERYLTYR